MYSTFTAAVACFLLASQAEAASKEEKFAKFIAKFSTKKYADKNEWNKRLANFERSDQIIENLNWQEQSKPEEKRVNLGHNFTSDLDEAEYLALLGDADPEHEELPTKGRKLQVTQDAIYDSVDYTYVSGVAGKMGPVRDQGSCGSCASFAGTMCLEGRYAVHNNVIAPTWSTQHGLDCSKATTNNNSCSGGLSYWYWDWYAQNGNALESDYPYRAVDQACNTSVTTYSNNLNTSNVWDRAQVTADATGALEMIAAIQDGPIAISINASNCDHFRYYTASKGALTAEHCPVTSASSSQPSTNHAVVVVEYVADPAIKNSAEGSAPVTEEITTTSTTTTCWAPNKGETKKNQCKNGGSFEGSECCLTQTTTSTETVIVSEGTGTIKQAGGYWKIQNSWGSGWGDNGFYKAEVTYDYGIIAMNKRAVWPNLV